MLTVVMLLGILAFSLLGAFIIMHFWGDQADRFVQRLSTRGDPARRSAFAVLLVIVGFMCWVDPWNLVWFSVPFGIMYGVGRLSRKEKRA